MVQYQAKEGNEVHFSANMEGGKKPMVGVYDRHTFARGRVNTSTGAASADIVHPHYVPIECAFRNAGC